MVIVGGGYTGLSAAIELARAGQHVQLFDRQLLGQAASGRHGGLASGSIRPGRKELIKRFGEEEANAIFREGKEARQDVCRFLIEEHLNCEFSLSGLFEGAMTTEETDELRRHAGYLHRTLGIEAFPVGRADVRKNIGTDFYVGGLVRKDIGGLSQRSCLRI